MAELLRLRAMTDRERLEAEFDNDMRQILENERDLKYNSSYFRRMLNEHGGVITAHLLLAANPRKMFKELRDKDRLDLTVEHYIVMDKYEPLFSSQERKEAWARLRTGE
jgi:hypothetical protein